jgi:hypothetical protein
VETTVRVLIRSDIDRRHHGDLGRLVAEAFAGIEAEGVEVHVERAKSSWESFTGRAYGGRPKRPRSHPSTRFLVRVKVPATLRNRSYPRTYRYPRLKTAPWITVRDWQERFVALVAHEAFHTRQFREGLRRSEVQAERWAAGILESWRETRPPLERVRERPAAARREVVPLQLRPLQLALFDGS